MVPFAVCTYQRSTPPVPSRPCPWHLVSSTALQAYERTGLSPAPHHPFVRSDKTVYLVTRQTEYAPNGGVGEHAGRCGRWRDSIQRAVARQLDK